MKDSCLKMIIPDPRKDSFLNFLSMFSNQSQMFNEDERNGNKIDINIENNNEKFVGLKNEDNLVLFETLSEYRSLFDKRYLEMVDKWINVLTNGSYKNTKLNEDQKEMKELLELKESIQSILSKCDMIGVSNSTKRSKKVVSDEVDEIDDFVDIPFEEEEEDNKENGEEEEEFESEIDESERNEIDMNEPTNESLNTTMESNTSIESIETEDLHQKHPIQKQKSSIKELFEQAPVIPFGKDLEYWGKEPPKSINVNTDLIESFWFRSNDSDHVSDIHKDTFTKRPVYLQPQIPHIRACRVRLKNGELCNRMDIEYCPFHGEIIDRNRFGKAVDKDGREIEEKVESKKNLFSDDKDGTHNKKLLQQWEKDNPSFANQILKNKKRKVKNQEAPGLIKVTKKKSSFTRINRIISERKSKKDLITDQTEEIIHKESHFDSW